MKHLGTRVSHTRMWSIVKPTAGLLPCFESLASISISKLSGVFFRIVSLIWIRCNFIDFFFLHRCRLQSVSERSSQIRQHWLRGPFPYSVIFHFLQIHFFERGKRSHRCIIIYCLNINTAYFLFIRMKNIKFDMLIAIPNTYSYTLHYTYLCGHNYKFNLTLKTFKPNNAQTIECASNLSLLLLQLPFDSAYVSFSSFVFTYHSSI